MKPIQLTNGMYTYVDSCDYDPLMRWSWGYHKDGYAYRTIGVGGKSYVIYMHRQILGLTDRFVECDHINGNRLDNRFGNLRAVTRLENANNRHAIPQHKGTSQYRGVHWNKECGKWRASIWNGTKTIALGFFTDEVLAARAYNAKALELFGVHANVNHILEELL